jgi:hypothetical protein
LIVKDLKVYVLGSSGFIGAHAFAAVFILAAPRLIDDLLAAIALNKCRKG